MKIFIDLEYCCHISDLDDIQITSWKSYDELDAAQRKYKKQSLTEYNETFSCLIG